MLQQHHGHLFQGRIAGPLTQAPNRHAHGFRSRLKGAERVGRGHAQIIMAMKLKGKSRNACLDGSNKVRNGFRAGNPHRIGNA